MSKHKDALMIIVLLTFAMFGIAEAAKVIKHQQSRANCVEGVICTSGSQIDCYEPTEAYAPEFGLVCPLKRSR